MANIYDMNAALQTPNIVENFNQGIQAAQLRRQNQNILNKQNIAAQDQQNIRALAPGILAGDPSAYSQAAAIDPDQADKYQGAANSQLTRIQGALNYLDQQKTPEAKQAAYQQAVKPFFAALAQANGHTVPDSYMDAQPGLDAMRAKISALGQQKSDLINVGAGGAVFDPKTRQAVYTNPGVQKTPGIVSVNLPDGSTQQYQQNPDGSLSPLRLAGQGSPSVSVLPLGSSATPQQGEGAAVTTSSPMAMNAADKANQYLAAGMSPEQAASRVNLENPTSQVQIAIDPATGQFKDVSDGSEQFKDAQPSGMGELGRSAPKQAADDKETFGAPQQVMGADGKPHLIQFGNRGGQREVTGFLKPDMTPAQAAKQAVQQEKANASKADAVSSYDQSINQIDSLLNSPGASMLGTYMGDVAGLIPHTDTSNAVAALDNIKNQVLLNTISKLKALSATGASGFGSLSNQEGEILKNSIASLDKKQSNDQLLSNLRQIKTMLQESRDRVAGKEVTFDNGSDQQTQSNAGQVKRYNPATGMIE